MTLRLQNEEDVFLLILLGTPPPVTSFPVPGYIYSQNDSQWKAHFFQGEFHQNLQGCHWHCALATKIRHSLRQWMHFPSPQLGSIPCQCLTQGKAKPKLVCPSCSPSSALQPQTCFFWRKTQTLKENTTYTNGSLCSQRGKRYFFYKHRIYLIPYSIPGPGRASGTQKPHFTRVNGWLSELAWRTADIGRQKSEGENLFAKDR